MKHSTIFKNRWMALLWAAGIIYFAVDVAGGTSGGDQANASANQTGLEDATGSPVSTDDEKHLADAIANL